MPGFQDASYFHMWVIVNDFGLIPVDGVVLPPFFYTAFRLSIMVAVLVFVMSVATEEGSRMAAETFTIINFFQRVLQLKLNMNIPSHTGLYKHE